MKIKVIRPSVGGHKSLLPPPLGSANGNNRSVTLFQENKCDSLKMKRKRVIESDAPNAIGSVLIKDPVFEILYPPLTVFIDVNKSNLSQQPFNKHN